ncbi:c-type cytochrome [Chitinophagaceae bacterium 26-R-25]|nr:c-type cytochrome [Chitinophagaceae bacterium 26-R-25]
MKRHLITIKTLAFMLCAVLISIVVVQCKKEGKNASSISRGLASSDIDSTIFSPFYDTTVLSISTAKSINDSIITTGIQSIIKANCANCHNNNIKPNLVTFNDIKSLVVPGNPEASKLWQVLTTNDLNKAMPPITTEKTVSTEDKISIYNWIKNGANETPVLADYRPTAVRLITGGCTAVCHNDNVCVGNWARKGNAADFGRPLTTLDTISAPVHGAMPPNPPGCLAINDTLNKRIWKTYQDSVVRYFTNVSSTDTVRKSPSSPLDPLNTYNNLLFNICYPNALRSVTVTNKVTKDLFASATSGNNNLLAKVDATISFKGFAKSGNMASGDGHLKSSEVAIIKGWYFLDPNIPDVWKYGNGTTPAFKDAQGNPILKK